MDRESLKPVIESLIFASSAAVSLDKLASVMEGVEKSDIRSALEELVEDYRRRNGGFFIEEVGGGYRFRTSPEAAPWLRRLFKIGMQKISKAAMESLAVVAYKQPVTRAELEAIRGVDCGGVLATLMDKRFIKIVGRKEVPGRPVVYGTTKEFLETFDLKDLSCLPSLKDIQKLEEEDGFSTPSGEGNEGQGATEERGGDAGEVSCGPEAEGKVNGEAEGAFEGEGGGFAPSEDRAPFEPAGEAGAHREPSGEAPEDNSLGRDNVEEEG
ncbi:MAG: SMC-Scp complex subunit ScpB [Deltaproteobacteria bacterium]|nr:SMC-Scp complex subunit ScpB [Deltaproteobacteria bacterium]